MVGGLRSVDGGGGESGELRRRRNCTLPSDAKGTKSTSAINCNGVDRRGATIAEDGTGTNTSTTLKSSILHNSDSSHISSSSCTIDDPNPWLSSQLPLNEHSIYAFTSHTATGTLLDCFGRVIRYCRPSAQNTNQGVALAGFSAMLWVSTATSLLGPMRDAAALAIGVSALPKLTLASTVLALCSSVPVGWLFEAPDPNLTRRRLLRRMGFTRGETQGTSLALFYRTFAMLLLCYGLWFRWWEQRSDENGSDESTGSTASSSSSSNLSTMGNYAYVAFFLLVHLMKLHSISLMWGVVGEALEYEEQSERLHQRQFNAKEFLRKKQEDEEHDEVQNLTRNNTSETALDSVETSAENASRSGIMSPSHPSSRLNHHNDHGHSSHTQQRTVHGGERNAEKQNSSVAKGGRSKARLLRLGFVGFGGTLGGIIGGCLASSTAHTLRISGLLFLAALILIMSANLSIELGKIMYRHWEEQQIVANWEEFILLTAAQKAQEQERLEEEKRKREKEEQRRDQLYQQLKNEETASRERRRLLQFSPSTLNRSGHGLHSECNEEKGDDDDDDFAAGAFDCDKDEEDETFLDATSHHMVEDDDRPIFTDVIMHGKDQEPENDEDWAIVDSSMKKSKSTGSMLNSLSASGVAAISSASIIRNNTIGTNLASMEQSATSSSSNNFVSELARDPSIVELSMKRVGSIGSMKRVASGNSLAGVGVGGNCGGTPGQGGGGFKGGLPNSKSMTQIHTTNEEKTTPQNTSRSVFEKSQGASVVADGMQTKQMLTAYSNRNNSAVLPSSFSTSTTEKRQVQEVSDSSFSQRLLRGVTTILRSRLLMAIFTYNALYASTTVLLSFQRAELVANRGAASASNTTNDGNNAESDTAFLARVSVASNLAVFALQASGFGAFLAHSLGQRGTLALMPMIRLGGILLLSWWHFTQNGRPPNLIVFLMLDELTRVINFAVAKPVRESLWRGLSNEARYEAKPIVDTLANRWGSGSAAVLVSLMDRILKWVGIIVAFWHNYLNSSPNDEAAVLVTNEESSGPIAVTGKFSSSSLSQTSLFGFPALLILCLIIAAWWVMVSFHLGHIRKRIDIELKKHQ